MIEEIIVIIMVAVILGFVYHMWSKNEPTNNIDGKSNNEDRMLNNKASPVFINELILVLLDNGVFKWQAKKPFFDDKGNIILDNPISDIELNDFISSAIQTYGTRYRGTYNMYTFRIDDKMIDIPSEYSFDEIRSYYPELLSPMIWVRPMIWGFKYKPEDARWNKHLLTMGLRLRFGENRTLGLGDKEKDGKLEHDIVLYTLARLEQMDMNVRIEARKRIESMIKNIPDKKRKILIRIMESMIQREQ